MTPNTPNEVNNGTRGRFCDLSGAEVRLCSSAGEASPNLLAFGRSNAEETSVRPLSGQATTDEAARLGDGHSVNGRGVGFPLDPNPIVELNKLSHAELFEYGIVKPELAGRIFQQCRRCGAPALTPYGCYTEDWQDDPIPSDPPEPTLRNIATALSVMALFGASAFLCALWTQRKAIGFIVLKAGIALLMLSGIWMGIALMDMACGAQTLKPTPVKLGGFYDPHAVKCVPVSYTHAVPGWSLLDANTRQYAKADGTVCGYVTRVITNGGEWVASYGRNGQIEVPYLEDAKRVVEAGCR